MTHKRKTLLGRRFRGFLPVVIDVETGGFNADKDALLELAAVFLTMDDMGTLKPAATHHWHIHPFAGANIDPKALAFNKIDPHHPFRFTVSEREAMDALTQEVQKHLKLHGCQRAVLVGHNAWFDLSFVQAAYKRTASKKNPFHSFTTFDTAALGALCLGHTVLGVLLDRAGLSYNAKEAHSALYDTAATAGLFCYMVNRWDKNLGSPSLSHNEEDEEDNDGSIE